MTAKRDADLLAQINKGFVKAKAQPKPTMRPFTVTGTGPNGQPVTIPGVRASDPGDAIWQLRKICALNNMTAKEER